MRKTRITSWRWPSSPRRRSASPPAGEGAPRPPRPRPRAARPRRAPPLRAPPRRPPSPLAPPARPPPPRAAPPGEPPPSSNPHADNSIPDYGTEAPTSERERAASEIGAYLTVRAEGNWAAACTYLSKPTRQGFEHLAASSSSGKAAGCAKIYAALSSRVPTSERANTLIHGLSSLRAKGVNGFALYVGPHGQQYVMPVRHEGGQWKVTQLSPIAYPVGAPASPGG